MVPVIFDSVFPEQNVESAIPYLQNGLAKVCSFLIFALPAQSLEQAS